MYERYYGLTHRPFELTADPRFLFLTEKHREALCHLRYGIEGHTGITVVIGPAGTGKTTLIHAALAGPERRRDSIVHLSNPVLSRQEFFESLAGGFGLSPAAAASKPRFLAELTAAVHASRREGSSAALVIDEAQSLPPDLLEEIRLLANIETPDAKLLTVILVGQPELAARLNDPAFAQLKQRVALRCTLPPLTLSQTFAYVDARLRTAGAAEAPIFTREAVELVHQRAGGIPRTINVICDNALLTGFALDRRIVGRAIIAEVCEDFDFGTPASAAPAPAAPAPAPPRPASAAPSAERPAGVAQRSDMFSYFGSRSRLSLFW